MLGPEGNFWAAGNEKLVRVSAVEPEAGPTPTAPRTQIKAGPKQKVKTRRKTGKVRFRFRSPDAGATFQCRMRRLPNKAKASKAARWGGCKSPRTYRLRPGRYRFEVRAVLAGVKDRTPAKRGFRVIRVVGR